VSCEKDDEEEGDERFIPIQNRINIKLPTLRRSRARSRSEDVLATSPHSGILKSPERTTIALPSPPLPTSSSASSAAMSTSPLSPSIMSSPAHLARLMAVPTHDCCKRCCHATEYGRDPEWKEKFSRAARKKRKQDLNQSSEKQAVAEQVARMEEEETEVPVCTGSGLARAHVDELACVEEDCAGEEAKDEVMSGGSGTEEEDEDLRQSMAQLPLDEASKAEERVSPPTVDAAPASESTPAKTTQPEGEPSAVFAPEVYIAPPTKATPEERPKTKRKLSSLLSFGTGFADASRASQGYVGIAPGRAFA
jgi:hypothetical protein